MNNNNNIPNQYKFSFRSPLFPDQIRRLDLLGKRSLNDFQQQTIGFYNRNVKPRSNYSSPVSTLSPITSLSSASINPIHQLNRHQSCSLLNQNVSANFPLPNLNNKQFSNNNNNNFNSVIKIPDSLGQVFSGLGQGQEDKKLMDQRLLELEKELLGDEEIATENVSSVLTDNEWSETIQNLLNNPISPSSSCNSTSASSPTSPKQSMIDAATALSDSKPEAALEILTRLQNVANVNGTWEQRLISYMVSALKSRVSPNDRPLFTDISSSEHLESTQLLFDVSPCFKLGFMAANLAILEAASEEKGLNKIHVVDFDIGKGGQYVHLLHALAAAKNVKKSLKITALGLNDEKMKYVIGGLKTLAQKLGVCLSLQVKNLSIYELSREKLEVKSDEALVVNFAFKLYKMPDESVTTENLRDELLRRVKGLKPVVMTVIEQEMNGNTAPLVTRVKDACDYYGALFESLELTMKDNLERVRIEEGMGRKLVNSVACEGKERVERCEVFGKWRARMSMAGFQPREMSQLAAESLRSKLNSGTRGNPGFNVSVEFGGICFGWKGRTLTVASAWR